MGFLLMQEGKLFQSLYSGLANKNNSIHQDLTSRKDWPRISKGSKACQMHSMQATILQITGVICITDRQFAQFEPSS